MRKYLWIIILVAFLFYGLIRLGVGSLLFGQEIELFDFQAFREPIKEVGEFLARSSDQQIVPVSVAGYLGYLALMGVVLTVGAIRSLRKQPLGLTFIGGFLVMYALLFANFQTINPKAIHLLVCTVLFGVLLWIKPSDPREARFRRWTPASGRQAGQ